MSEVIHDTTLTGKGISGQPLGVASVAPPKALFVGDIGGLDSVVYAPSETGMKYSLEYEIPSANRIPFTAICKVSALYSAEETIQNNDIVFWMEFWDGSAWVQGYPDFRGVNGGGLLNPILVKGSNTGFELWHNMEFSAIPSTLTKCRFAFAHNNALASQVTIQFKTLFVPANIAVQL